MKAVWLLGLVVLGGTAIAGDLPANVTVLEEGLVVEQFPDAASAELAVFQGDELVSKTQFDPADGLVLPFVDMQGQSFTDGSYTFTVTYAPHVLGKVPADEQGLQNGRDLVPLTAGQGGVVSGHFRLMNGSVHVAENEINNGFNGVEK